MSGAFSLPRTAHTHPDHEEKVDAHGDRAYADGEIAGHVADTDPHGDRTYTDDEVAGHVADTDPHGDRAYADDVAEAWAPVSNSNGGTSNIDLTNAYQTLLSVDVTIPSSWASWRPVVHGWATIHNRSSGSAAPAANRALDMKATAAGSDLGQVLGGRVLTTPAATDSDHGGTFSQATALTGTGSKTFTLEAKIGATDNYRVNARQLVVVCYRVS